jgi:tetratricopeptide (TPR) repeat protein
MRQFMQLVGLGSIFSRLGLLVFLLILGIVSPVAHATDLAPPAAAAQLLSAGRVDDAIEGLEKQIQSGPSAQSYNLLCRAYYMLGDWDRGIQACEQASQLDPGAGIYQLWLGRAYGEKADHSSMFSAARLARKVRESFERAVQMDPTNWKARADLAEFYVEAPAVMGGGKEKALQEAAAIAPINPAIAHWIAARVAEKNKDSVAAERQYRAAIAASNSGARAWNDLASFLKKSNRLEEMELALTRLEAAHLDEPDALMDGAHMLLETGRNFPLAERLLRRYVCSPDEEGPAFRAHDILGQLLEKQGKREAAAGEYRAALELAHGYAQAQQDLNRVSS